MIYIRMAWREPGAPAPMRTQTIMVASMKACSILHAYALLMIYASSVKLRSESSSLATNAGAC